MRVDNVLNKLSAVPGLGTVIGFSLLLWHGACLIYNKVAHAIIRTDLKSTVQQNEALKARVLTYDKELVSNDQECQETLGLAADRGEEMLRFVATEIGSLQTKRAEIARNRDGALDALGKLLTPESIRDELRALDDKKREHKQYALLNIIRAVPILSCCVWNHDQPRKFVSMPSPEAAKPKKPKTE
ncbi:MAG: hypothetical protein H0X51_07285 [Parachlamydiaceae bacterium]|nr:hypothetical protein [Parachlamydiaceae bacterium]